MKVLRDHRGVLPGQPDRSSPLQTCTFPVSLTDIFKFSHFVSMWKSAGVLGELAQGPAKGLFIIIS